MEYNVPKPIVTETKSYLKFLLILLMVAMLMSSVIHVYLWYQKSQLSSGVEVVTTEQSTGEYPGSYGLGGEVSADTPPTITGNVYFSSLIPGASGTTPLPKIFKYSLTNKKITPVGTGAQTDWHALTPATAVVLATTTGSDQTTTWQPYQYNVKTGVLTSLQNVQGSNVESLDTATDGVSYAYSYQTIDQAATDTESLKNWNIAIHTKTGEVQKIEKAHEPKWLPGGTQLLYVAEGGLYRYDILTKTATLVFATYAPYLKIDDIGISPDGKTVILTKPYAKLLSVLTFTAAGQLGEVGRIISGDTLTLYRRPVFSPDGQFYVVQATKINDIDPSKGTYTLQYSFEVRSVASAQVIESVPLPDASNRSILLSSWLPE